MAGLIRYTDPARVGFLIDFGHVHIAGHAPELFLPKYAERIAGLHPRNVSRDGERVRLGAGLPPLEPIATIRAQATLAWMAH